MATQKKADQLLYAGRGPLDAKSSVKTYAELLDPSTWTTSFNNVDTFVAYNGMIVAVWLNKDDTTKNGIYFLYDPAVTSAVKKPAVENEENWHRFCALSDLENVVQRLDQLEQDLAGFSSRIDDLEDKAAEVFADRTAFPVTGIANKLYIDSDAKLSYVWLNGNYEAIGGSSAPAYFDTIYGGSAVVN